MEAWVTAGPCGMGGNETGAGAEKSLTSMLGGDMSQPGNLRGGTECWGLPSFCTTLSGSMLNHARSCTDPFLVVKNGSGQEPMWGSKGTRNPRGRGDTASYCASCRGPSEKCTKITLHFKGKQFGESPLNP